MYETYIDFESFNCIIFMIKELKKNVSNRFMCFSIAVSFVILINNTWENNKGNHERE